MTQAKASTDIQPQPICLNERHCYRNCNCAHIDNSSISYSTRKKSKRTYSKGSLNRNIIYQLKKKKRSTKHARSHSILVVASGR